MVLGRVESGDHGKTFGFAERHLREEGRWGLGVGWESDEHEGGGVEGDVEGGEEVRERLFAWGRGEGLHRRGEEALILMLVWIYMFILPCSRWRFA